MSTKEEDFAPGVEFFKGHDADVYTGQPTALLAAGLVKPEHMPGTPGMSARTTVIFADGTIPSDPRCGGERRKAAGAKRIHLYHNGVCRLEVYVDKPEADRRWTKIMAKMNRDEDQWYRDQGMLPPPQMVQRPASNVIDFEAYKARNAGNRSAQW